MLLNPHWWNDVHDLIFHTKSSNSFQKQGAQCLKSVFFRYLHEDGGSSDDWSDRLLFSRLKSRGVRVTMEYHESARIQVKVYILFIPCAFKNMYRLEGFIGAWQTNYKSELNTSHLWHRALPIECAKIKDKPQTSQRIPKNLDKINK